MKRFVYHGTHRSFLEPIREKGLPAFPSEAETAGVELRRSPGVRVRLSYPEALRDARAWTAYLLVTERMKPEGMVVVAIVEERRIRLDRLGVMRVTRLEPSEVKMRGPIEFPEFGAMMLQGKRSANLSDARGAVEDALKDFEVLTRRKVSKPFAINRRS